MKSNQVKVYIFVIIILIFIFGGFYLMKKSEHLKNEVNQTVTEIKSTDIRTDPTKEYIYYTNVNVVEGELDIEYKDININFEDKEGIQNILNKENPIKVEDTINNLSNYELYVDKLGRLVITILVKAEQNDYNDVIVLS